MIRRLMTIGMLLLILTSCYYFNQVVDDIKDESITTKTRKKISSNNYLNLSYDGNPLTNEIAQKIIKANGFVNTCK